MDIESLRLFVLAADRLNISAAGRELGMPPAVASSRLAKLERDVGADLLRRTTRKVSLSVEGAEFLPFAREILEQENAARAALGQGKSKASGTLRFAAPSTFAQLYIVPVLDRFLNNHPDCRLDLRLSDTPFDLIEGSFDLALRSAPLIDTSFKGRKLADDKRILCASADYLQKFGMPEKPEDLKEHQLIAFRNQNPKYLGAVGDVDGVFDPSGNNCRLVMDDGQSLKLATLAGAGVSINSVWSVYNELRNGTLVQVLPEYQVQDQTVLWLLYPKSNVLTTKVRVFIDFLLENIGKSPPWTR